MDIIEQLNACNGLENSDEAKIEIVDKIQDPLDLLKVIVEWGDDFGDPYYNDFHRAIVGSAARILRGE